jgi:ubiquitin-like-conjugating enzyme ATG10
MGSMWTASDFEIAAERLLAALAGRPLIVYGLECCHEQDDNDDGPNPRNVRNNEKKPLHLQWECRRGEIGTSFQLVVNPPLRIACRTEFWNRHRSDNVDDDDPWTDEDIDIDDDAAALETNDYNQNIENEWKFSIVYSDTWQTPVLYFTVHNSRGVFLSRPEILRLMPLPKQPLRSDSNHHNPWTDNLSLYDFVSADEHPISGVPSYFLHPCRVNSLLQTMMIMDDKEDYVPEIRLLSWMALMLPNAGLRIPPDTYLYLHAKARMTDRLSEQLLVPHTRN